VWSKEAVTGQHSMEWSSITYQDAGVRSEQMENIVVEVEDHKVALHHVWWFERSRTAGGHHPHCSKREMPFFRIKYFLVSKFK